MNNKKAYIPSAIAAFCNAWFGIDFLLIRDLSGNFTYWFNVPQSTVDNLVGFLAVLAAVLIVLGLTCGREVVTRVGYISSGMSFLIFGMGFLLQAIFIRDNGIAAGAFSAAAPGFTYGLLGVWMVITGTTEWGESVDPHQ